MKSHIKGTKRHHTRGRSWMRDAWIDLFLITLGAAIVAISFNILLRPNQIVPGGVLGLSIILESKFYWAPAVSQWVINMLFLALGGFLLGRNILIKGLLGTLLIPAFVILTTDINPITDDTLLASICGGVGTGFGIGLILRGNGAPGGFGTLSSTLVRTLGIPVGRTLLVLDSLVLFGALILYPAEKILAALVAVFLLSRTVQAVLAGLDTSKVAIIISNESEVIRSAILKDLDLGLTIIEGTGGYTGDNRSLSLVVMRPSDVFRLKKKVAEYDEHAFMILTDASEVLGHGFKTY